MNARLKEGQVPFARIIRGMRNRRFLSREQVIGVVVNRLSLYNQNQFATHPELRNCVTRDDLSFLPLGSGTVFGFINYCIQGPGTSIGYVAYMLELSIEQVRFIGDSTDKLEISGTELAGRLRVVG